MKKILLCFSLIAVVISMLMTSCTSSYKISGASNISMLDGKCFFMKTFKEDDMVTIDSCEVVHGQFSFSGSADSVRLAFVGYEEFALPVILEEGEINIKLNMAEEEVSGTPLNDKFSDFRKQMMRVGEQIEELSRKDSQGIMDGVDMDSLQMELGREYEALSAQYDSITTSFVCNNFGSPLAAIAFQYVTLMHIQVPELTPWVEDILSKADDRFNADPYVKAFVERAKYAQKLLNGTLDQVDGNVIEPTDSVGK